MEKKIINMCRNIAMICLLSILVICASLVVDRGIAVQAATRGQKEALESAKSYIKYLSFSKEGLRDQLDYEGFSKKEINYAIKKCKANWKKECLESAKSYLKTSGFSKKGLKEQLEYEGYTKKEIKYAFKRCKANWKRECKEAAESYLEYMSFSKQELIEQLEYEGFTTRQINYALRQVGY